MLTQLDAAEVPSSTLPAFMPFNVVVTGSRKWTDRVKIREKIEALHKEHDDLVIYHGACWSGADKIADSIAKELGIPVKTFPADWSQGPSAGPVRNRAMLEAADPKVVLAFATPSLAASKGTLSAVTYARRMGIEPDVTEM